MNPRLTAASLASLAALVPFAAPADPPPETAQGAAGDAVTVLRGGRVASPDAALAPGEGDRSTDWVEDETSGVVVLRPPPDSFLRETTRLAAEAAAREAEIARSEARLTTRQLSLAVRALEFAAVELAARRSAARRVIFVPVVLRRDGIPMSDRIG